MSNSAHTHFRPKTRSLCTAVLMLALVGTVTSASAQSLDIKPGSCPNSFNVKSRGVLPVAILGTDQFDATGIDPTSVSLSRADGVGGSIAPLAGPPGPGASVQDAGTPFVGAPCDCHELMGDGISDLALKFDSQEIVSTLQLDTLAGGTLVELVLSGTAADGTTFDVRDCIRLVPNH